MFLCDSRYNLFVEVFLAWSFERILEKFAKFSLNCANQRYFYIMISVSVTTHFVYKWRNIQIDYLSFSSENCEILFLKITNNSLA